MSLSRWFHERSQPGRGRESLLQHNDEGEDIESVTTIMSARSGNMLRRPMLVRSSPSHGPQLISRLQTDPCDLRVKAVLNLIEGRFLVGVCMESAANACRVHAGMQDEATFKQEGVPIPGQAAGAPGARTGRGPSMLGPGAAQVEPEQATVNAPKLLERPVPARANPMAFRESGEPSPQHACPATPYCRMCVKAVL